MDEVQVGTLYRAGAWKGKMRECLFADTKR